MLNDDLDRKINKLKIRRTVYIILAVVLILVNVLVDLLEKVEEEKQQAAGSLAEKAGYFLGSHFFIVFALYLIFRIIKINKKIKELKNIQTEEMIDEIGNNE